MVWSMSSDEYVKNMVKNVENILISDGKNQGLIVLCVPFVFCGTCKMSTLITICLYYVVKHVPYFRRIFDVLVDVPLTY